MSGLYDKAFAAYRALCELEDELDAMAAESRLPTAPARDELGCLLRRWENDTARKLERALQGAAQR